MGGWHFCTVVWNVIFHGFQLLLTRKVRLLVDGLLMVDGLS